MQYRINYIDDNNTVNLNILLDSDSQTKAYMDATEILDAGLVEGATDFKLFNVTKYEDTVDA